MPANNSGEAAAIRLQKVFRRYLELNTRNASELVAHLAKSATIEFYRTTKAAAPSKEKIKQDVLALDWKVKRPKKAYPYRKGEKRGSKGPLNRMRAAVIRRRQRAIGRAASGYLPALDALGAKVSGKDAANFPNPLGRLDVTGTGSSQPGIVVTNSTPGIVSVNQKHNIVVRGLNNVTRDKIDYIRRKQDETARTLNN